MAKNYTLEEKIKIVKESYALGINKTKLANSWNISRPTLDKWIKLYDVFGAEGLTNKKTGPNRLNLNEKDYEIAKLKAKIKRMEKEIELSKKLNAAIESWNKNRK